MKILTPLFCLFALLSTVKGGEFFDPITLFAPIIVPAMKGFETSKTETFLRGFSFRGDSFPGIKREAPSDYGMFLRVTIHDEGPDVKLHDKITNQDGVIYRRVTLPQKSSDGFSLEIEFSHGKNASPAVITAIKTLIDKLVATYK